MSKTNANTSDLSPQRKRVIKEAGFTPSVRDGEPVGICPCGESFKATQRDLSRVKGTLSQHGRRCEVKRALGALERAKEKLGGSKEPSDYNLQVAKSCAEDAAERLEGAL